VVAQILSCLICLKLFALPRVHSSGSARRQPTLRSALLPLTLTARASTRFTSEPRQHQLFEFVLRIPQRLYPLSTKQTATRDRNLMAARPLRRHRTLLCYVWHVCAPFTTSRTTERNALSASAITMVERCDNLESGYYPEPSTRKQAELILSC
jgi:hypothetical protein